MDTDAPTRRLPWQPLTFGGAAAFAHAPTSRLLLIVFAAAFIVAGSVICFFYRAWEPGLRRAVARLPDEGTIRGGRLDWHGTSPIRLTDGNFLSIIVDLGGTGEPGGAADVECELGRTEFRLRSLLGSIGIPYPSAWVVALNRPELEPWWGAWHPVVAAGLGGAVLLGLLFSWTVLGAVYALPTQLIAFYANRQISAFGAWRLAVASLMPGALVMAAAILAYGFQRLNLVQLLVAQLAHVTLGWVYVLVSPWWLPRHPSPDAAGSPGANPFHGPGSNQDTGRSDGSG